MISRRILPASRTHEGVRAQAKRVEKPGGYSILVEPGYILSCTSGMSCDHAGFKAA